MTTRICLTLAATACCLAPTGSAWAQAYGAGAIVENNDLRWFEPAMLDLDGQMSDDGAGYFFRFDKTYWASGNPRTVVGDPGRVVDSERIFRAPSNEVAFTALEQTEALPFITDVPETLANAGIGFEVADLNDPDTLRDDEINPGGVDLETALGAPLTSFANVAALKTAINNFNNNAGNQALGRVIRVAGEPIPFAVQNGIRDALTDAEFAWGERYEFGYSNGERGWMIGILDGPESVSGGVWGAGEAAPYTSQSGTDVFGPDPYFLGDLEDDDNDGIGDGDGEQGAADIFALGFGSVAVNFDLTGNEDLLVGYRDYNNGQTPFTTSGPILYVGNVGAEFTDINVTGFNGGVGGGSTTPLNTNAATITTNNVITETNGNMDAGIVASNGTQTENSVDLIRTQLDAANALTPALETQLNATDTAVDAMNAAISGASVSGGMLDNPAEKQNITNLAGDVNVELNVLNSLLVGVDLGTGGAGGATGVGNQQVTVTEEDRQADDIDGNGQAGFTIVRADLNNDGNIDAGEIVGLINNFGDLHTFNIFFDQVTVRNRTSLDGVELMRMHELSTRHKQQQGRWDNIQFAYGVRLLSLKDDYFMQGLGSVVGRTTVSTEIENQVVGPQIALNWTRRDGKWNFLFSGRAMAGYNIVDVDQNGIFGEELVPGALNRPAIARTVTSVDGDRFNEFSPIAELRAEVHYRLAESITLRAGFTAKYVANVHRAGLSTAFRAPDFGIIDQTSDIFVNGLNFGVELRH